MKKVVIAGWLLIGSMVSAADYVDLAYELMRNNDTEAVTKIVESEDFSLNEAAFEVLKYTSKDVVLKFLLDHGLDVNAENEHGKSLLCALIEQPTPCLYQAKLLINRGANIGNCGRWSKTPLIIKAIKHGHLAIVGILLQQGIDVNMVHGARGDSLLMHAAKENAGSIAVLLLRKGANLLAFNKRHQTALMIAEEHKYKFAARALRVPHVKLAANFHPQYYSFTDLFSHLYFQYKTSPDCWEELKNFTSEFNTSGQIEYVDCQFQKGDNCWFMALWNTAKHVALYEASQSGKDINIDEMFSEKQFENLCKQAHEMQSNYKSKSKRNVYAGGSTESKIKGANSIQSEHFVRHSAFFRKHLMDHGTDKFKQYVLRLPCGRSALKAFNEHLNDGSESAIRYMLSRKEDFQKIYEFCKGNDKHLFIDLGVNTINKEGKADHAIAVDISWSNGNLRFEVQDSSSMYVFCDEQYEATFRELNELILKTRLFLFNEAFPKKLTFEMRFRELERYMCVMKNHWAKENKMGLV